MMGCRRGLRDVARTFTPGRFLCISSFSLIPCEHSKKAIALQFSLSRTLQAYYNNELTAKYTFVEYLRSSYAGVAPLALYLFLAGLEPLTLENSHVFPIENQYSRSMLRYIDMKSLQKEKIDGNESIRI